MGYAQIISGIYCIKNVDTGKKYIGQSKNIYKRWIDHRWALNNKMHDNDYLQKAWDKYGETHFVFSIIEECSIEQLDEREMYYITTLATCNREFGYNLRGGGGRLADMTPEVIEKLSGKNNPMYGKHHTEAAKKKMSEARKGVYSGKNHPRCRAVYCVELNQVFWGAKEVENIFNIGSSNICSCCNGKLASAGKHPDTNEKLHWLYLSDALDMGYLDITNIAIEEVHLYGYSI